MLIGKSKTEETAFSNISNGFTFTIKDELGYASFTKHDDNWGLCLSSKDAAYLKGMDAFIQQDQIVIVNCKNFN